MNTLTSKEMPVQIVSVQKENESKEDIKSSHIFTELGALRFRVYQVSE